MSDFKKEIRTPLETLQIIAPKETELPEWITYNPELTKKNGAQLERRGQMSHDGTFIHFIAHMQDLLWPLLTRQCCVKGNENIHNPYKVHYEVGPVRTAIVFGQISVPAGTFFGERNRSRMFVKVTYT